MTFPIRRCLLIAIILLFQFQFLSYSKTPKGSELEGLAYVTFPGQPKPAKDILAVLVRQARWDNGDWNLLNRQGLRLRFVKVDDRVTLQGTSTRYRIFAEGAPENKVYGWSVWRVGKEMKNESGDIYVNAQGLLMTHRPLPEEENSFQAPDEFSITPDAVQAEPFRYDLSSRDSQLSILGTLVTQPVIAQDRGCKLEARIAQPNTAAVLFVADGFPAESRIPLVLESEGETANLVMETDQAGHSIAAGFPYVKGKTQGTLKATAEGPDCLPSVLLPWTAGGPLVQKTAQ